MAKKRINNEKLKKEKEKVNKFIAEFKTFVSRGNVLDLAVGVVVGGAFSKIVTSLVNDIITPLIGVVIGGKDFSGLSLKIGDSTIAYGLFIQNIIDFIIIAFCIFVFIKFINQVFIKKKEEEKKEEPPKKTDEVLLLEEIRDLLKQEKKSSKK
jgi:large conductance mechanosensitive channel